MTSNRKPQEEQQQNQEQDQERPHHTEVQDQSDTLEQLSDVYAAGTSDGMVQLADSTMHIPNEGYEQDA